MSFSENFLWGAASAAHQIEGAFNEDGKVLGVWDALCEGHVKHGESGKVACDHYHRYKDDIALMKQIGLKSYRFSVSWCRVISDKNGTVNERGLQFYKDLVDQLCSAGITPICTLFHWNMPMWAYEEGGWKNGNSSLWFRHYVETVVKALSDKVAYWVTLNEPQGFVGFGHYFGEHAPFEKNDELTMAIISRNVMLAHGEAVQAIRKYAALTPKIGYAPTASAYVPQSNDSAEIEKAKEITYGKGQKFFGTAWWSDSLILGKFPQPLEEILTERDKKTICQPLDFYGFNTYTAANYNEPQGGKRNGQRYEGCPITTTDWVISPDILYWAPKFLYERYKLPIFVSENGMANTDFIMSDGRVHDPQRIDYIRRHLSALERATEEVPVLGYQYWSLTDNFEWAEGYDRRFGLIYIDYPTQRRVLKDSAYYYKKVIESNGAVLKDTDVFGM